VAGTERLARAARGSSRGSVMATFCDERAYPDNRGEYDEVMDHQRSAAEARRNGSVDDDHDDDFQRRPAVGVDLQRWRWRARAGPQRRGSLHGGVPLLASGNRTAAL